MSVRLLVPAFILLCHAACIVPDSMLDAYVDRDRDGEWAVAAGGTDCDDARPTVGVLREERCHNGIDDNCDGIVDDAGVGAIRFFRDACEQPEGAALSPNDCDDGDAARNPDQLEDCSNGVDDDCDGQVDEADNPLDWYPDVDRDGFGDARAVAVRTCAATDGLVANRTDCDDNDADAYPGAPEVPYDGRDSACDGGDDFDLDGDGVRVDPATAVPAVTDPTYVPPPAGMRDCDDRDGDVNPGRPEVWYDGIDSNCDGRDDFDADEDGHARIPEGDDCDDTNDRRSPSNQEIVYNSVDEDCDPANDHDADGDGRASSDHGGTDCDDTNRYVWDLCFTCEDRDGDGAYVGCNTYDDEQPFDCDDDPSHPFAPFTWSTCASCGDADSDGVASGCDTYRGGPEDCDDTNPVVWTSCATCGDADGDGYWWGCQNTQHPAYPPDCDDELANAWVNCLACVDADGDGYGVGTCGGPEDCDDADADVWASCDTCTDADDDISRAGCDAYNVWPYDCDDADPDVGGHNYEIIGDGIDQDCNGRDLTVSETDGVFVAPTGVDAVGCGTMAMPCATPGRGAQEARGHGDKVVFVAEGVYPSFTTYVSVYGGFEAAGWTRDLGLYETEVGEPVFLEGKAVSLLGLQLSSGPSSNLATGVLVRSKVANLVDVGLVLTTGLANVFGVQGPVLRFQLVDSWLSIESAGGNVDGVKVTGGSLSKVTIQRSHIEASTPVDTGSCQGFRQIGGSATIQDSLIECEGGAATSAVRWDSTSSPSAQLSVSDSTFRASNIGGEGSKANGLYTTGGESVAVMRSVLKSASTWSATAAMLTSMDSGGTRVVLDTCYLNADGSVEARGLDLWMASGASIQPVLAATTIQALGSSDSAGLTILGTVGESRLVNLAVDVEGVGLVLQSGLDAQVRGSLIHAPETALVTDGGPTPASVGLVSGQSCVGGSCFDVEGISLSAPLFDSNSSLGVTPLASSPLIGLGVEPVGWSNSSIDLLGNQRPTSGPWTAGAIEP